MVCCVMIGPRRLQGLLDSLPASAIVAVVKDEVVAEGHVEAVPTSLRLRPIFELPAADLCRRVLFGHMSRQDGYDVLLMFLREEEFG